MELLEVFGAQICADVIIGVSGIDKKELGKIATASYHRYFFDVYTTRYPIRIESKSMLTVWRSDQENDPDFKEMMAEQGRMLDRFKESRDKIVKYLLDHK